MDRAERQAQCEQAVDVRPHELNRNDRVDPQVAAAIGGALAVARRIVRIDVPIMIVVSILLWLLVLDEQLGRVEGIGLTMGLVAYIAWTVRAARREDNETDEPMELVEVDLDPAALRRHTVSGDLGYVALGLVLLVAGSQALVGSASDIAEHLPRPWR